MRRYKQNRTNRVKRSGCISYFLFPSDPIYAKGIVDMCSVTGWMFLCDKGFRIVHREFDLRDVSRMNSQLIDHIVKQPRFLKKIVESDGDPKTCLKDGLGKPLDMGKINKNDQCG